MPGSQYSTSSVLPVGWLVGLATAVAIGPPGYAQIGYAQTPSPDAVVGIASQRRFVKAFDFDERKRGNLERIPILWFQIHKQGYPLYGKGGFDHKAGHPSPPSFRLEPNGGNVAFRYRGKEIPIQPDSDYEITAWVLTEGLHHARASLQAFFMNRGGRVLEGSQRRSAPILIAGDEDSWQKVRILVPGLFPDARFMGLIAGVEQPNVWDSRPKPPGHIEQVDIHGGANFDQIEIYRLPRVLLRTTARGQVFAPDEPVRLTAEVADPDGLEISANLVIRSADGTKVLEKAVGILTRRNVTPDEIFLEELDAGLYTALLEVRTGSRILARRKLNFAKLSPRIRPKLALSSGFGIILDEAPAGDWRNEEYLLRTSLADHVKIPVWRAGMSLDQIAMTDERFYPLVQALARQRVEMTGVFEDAPQALVDGSKNSSHSLVTMFQSNPDAWSPFFRLTLSRYGPLIAKWQLGADGDLRLLWDTSYPSVLNTLAEAIRRHQPHPQLVAPWSVEHTQPPGLANQAHLSTWLPREIPPAAIAEQIANIKTDVSKQLWVVVSALSSDRYRRIPRLEDFAKRLIHSYEGNADTVFIRAPWRRIPWTQEPQLEPLEEYLILRTVADVLHGSEPIGRFALGHGAVGRAFAYENLATLVLWDAQAGRDGREYSLPIGRDHEQVDLWGRRTPLEAVEGHDNSIIRLTSTPVFISGVHAWLARLLTSLELQPGDVEGAIGPIKQTIRFVNPRSETTSGRFTITGPADWRITPYRINFSLRPGETFEREITIKYPYNHPSDEKILILDMTLNTDKPYRLSIPLPFRIRLEDITVRTLVQVNDERDEVIVQQQITNRSKETVTLRGFVLATDVPHKRQLISSLAPGRTVTREYVLPGAATLRGKRLRIGVLDRDGARIYNEEVVVP